MKNSLVNIGLTAILLTSLFLVSATTSVGEAGIQQVSSYSPRQENSTQPYNPWADLDADGDIDIFDIVNVSTRYDTTGSPVKDVVVTNWPSLYDVNVTNWPDYFTYPSQPNQPSWITYIGHHNWMAPTYNLIPEQNLGQIGMESVPYYFTGHVTLNNTYHTLGKVDLTIPKNREIIAKVSFSCNDNAWLENLTLEFGYTDKTTYTALANAEWSETPWPPLDADIRAFTLELGSLSSDTTIESKYIYFKVYAYIGRSGTATVSLLSDTNRKDLCILIPQS